MPIPITSIDFPSLHSRQPHRASSAICPSNHARSRFQTALSGERVVMRAMMARPCRSASSAFAFSPPFLNASARFACDTAKSRCQPALPGSKSRLVGAVDRLGRPVTPRDSCLPRTSHLRVGSSNFPERATSECAISANHRRFPIQAVKLPAQTVHLTISMNMMTARKLNGCHRNRRGCAACSDFDAVGFLDAYCSHVQQGKTKGLGTAMADIYGLYSGRNGIVRYVGQTVGDCKYRFEQHKRSPSTALYEWFHREWRDGYPIEFVLLQSVDDDVRGPAERHWMAKFPGLLNDRISAQTWFRGACAKPPKIPAITAYMRRYLFNVGGFRGICYDRHWDCYRVLMYTGSGADWLFGDECDEMMPGWGGNMWFPDRTAALIARDKARQWRRYVKWPSDVVLPEDELFSVESCPASIRDDSAVLEDA
jgi:hypothetical protein